MAVYPSTPVPRYDSTRGKRLPAIRTESEGGYGQTRRMFTKARVMFELKYDNITLAEYETLESFFISNQGTIFSFTHPLYPLETHDVMFANDDMKATDTDIGRCSTSVSLIGV